MNETNGQNEAPNGIQGCTAQMVWIDEWASFVPADTLQDLDKAKAVQEYAQNWLDRYAPGTQLSDLGTFPSPHRPRRRSAFAPGGNVSPTLPVLARRDGGQFSPVTDDDVAKALADREEANADVVKSRQLVKEAQDEMLRLQSKAERHYARFRKQRELVSELVKDRDANDEHRKDCDDRLAELDRARRTQLQVPVQPEWDPEGSVVIEYTRVLNNGSTITNSAVRRRHGGRRPSFTWAVSGQSGTLIWEALLQRVQSGQDDRQAALDSVRIIAYTPSPQAEGLAQAGADIAAAAVRPRF